MRTTPLRHRHVLQLVLVALTLGLATGCAPGRHEGVWGLRWIEDPGHAPTTRQAAPQDRVHFNQIATWDPDVAGADFAAVSALLREGDVIAFRMNGLEADAAILTGHLNRIGYRLYKYGHLAVLVEDSSAGEGLRQFSSESFRGPNTQETLAELAHHRWEAYRLSQPERLDTNRLHEFVAVAKDKAGHWAGYDFVGMFALWNSRLDPETPEQVGSSYICSTTVLAAYHYAGITLDAAYAAGVLPLPGTEHHGPGDLVTPKQVVESEGTVRIHPTDRIEAVRE